MNLNDQQYSGAARRLGGKGMQRPSILMHDQNSEGVLRVESRLERLIALALSVDPRVSRIKAQPFSIRLDTAEIFPTQSLARQSVGAQFGLSGEGLIYTPDFLVELVTGEHLVVECKPKHQADLLVEYFARVGSVLHGIGLRFIVFTDADVSGRGLEGNLIRIKDAKRMLRKSQTNLMANSIECVSSAEGDVQVAELLESWSESEVLVAISMGVIATDLRSGPFSKKMKVQMAYGDLSHLQILGLEH